MKELSLDINTRDVYYLCVAGGYIPILDNNDSAETIAAIQPTMCIDVVSKPAPLYHYLTYIYVRQPAHSDRPI